MASGYPATVNSLTDDAEGGKYITLFGGDFLERTTKRLEAGKNLAKVTGTRHGGGRPPKC